MCDTCFTWFDEADPCAHEVGARIIDDETGALPPLSPQEQKKFEYYENLRVELAVIMYGRVRDHLGYNHQIFEKVSNSF